MVNPTYMTQWYLLGVDLNTLIKVRLWNRKGAFVCHECRRLFHRAQHRSHANSGKASRGLSQKRRVGPKLKLIIYTDAKNFASLKLKSKFNDTLNWAGSTITFGLSQRIMG